MMQPYVFMLLMECRRCAKAVAKRRVRGPYCTLASEKPEANPVGGASLLFEKVWHISHHRQHYARLSEDAVMPRPTQQTSNIAALVLAAVALAYVLVPAEYFVGLLIVVPLVGLSIAAWLGYALRKGEGGAD